MYVLQDSLLNRGAMVRSCAGDGSRQVIAENGAGPIEAVRSRRARVRAARPTGVAVRSTHPPPWASTGSPASAGELDRVELAKLCHTSTERCRQVRRVDSWQCQAGAGCSLAPWWLVDVRPLRPSSSRSASPSLRNVAGVELAARRVRRSGARRARTSRLHWAFARSRRRRRKGIRFPFRRLHKACAAWRFSRS